MILTSHVNHEGQKVVAIIDDELLGRRIDGGDIELRFDASFYDGSPALESDILSEIRESYMLNCAGENTVRFLKDHGIIADEDVAIIEGIPYVYVLFSERADDA